MDRCINKNSGPRIDPVQQAEVSLRSATEIAELAMELKEEAHNAEKQLTILRNHLLKSSRTISVIRNLGKYLLLLSKALCKTTLKTMEDVQLSSSTPFYRSISMEFDRLIALLDSQTEDSEAEFPEFAHSSLATTFSATIERINQLETKFKRSNEVVNMDPPRSPVSNQSLRSIRMEINERYPETGSGHEAFFLLDFQQLPTVLEDIYFDPHHVRKSISQQSLKQKIQVRRLLPKDEEFNSDDDEERKTSGELDQPSAQPLTGIVEEER